MPPSMQALGGALRFGGLAKLKTLLLQRTGSLLVGKFEYAYIYMQCTVYE